MHAKWNAKKLDCTKPVVASSSPSVDWGFGNVETMQKAALCGFFDFEVQAFAASQRL
jgi:hypothetical protein